MNVLDLFNDDNRRGYRTMLEGIASNLVESKKLEQKTTINEGVRLIGSKEAGNRSVKVFRDTEWNEYIVRFYIDDEYQEEADYHTDDKQDAVDTAGKWLKGFPKQGVAEDVNTGPQIIYATGPRTMGMNDVDLVFKDLRTGKIVAHVVGNNYHPGDDKLQEFAPPAGGGGGGDDNQPKTANYEIRMNNSKLPTYLALGDPQEDTKHKVYKLVSGKTDGPTYYGMGMTLVSKLDWWSFLEKMLGEIMWEDDAIEAGYVDRQYDGDLVFVKQQGVAEGSFTHQPRLDQRNAVEQVALHNRQQDYFNQFVEWSGKPMKDIYNDNDNHELAYKLENLGKQIAGNWRNQQYYKPGSPDREKFYATMKQWYDLYNSAYDKFTKEQGVAEGQTEGEATLAKIAAAGDEGWDMIDDGINGLLGTEAQIMLQDMYDDVSREYRLHPDDDFEQIFDRMMDRIQDDYGQSGVAEDQEQDPVAAFLARGGKIQHGKTHKPRKAEKWQGSAHIGTAGGKGSKGTVSGLGANTNPRSGKPVVAAEQAVAEAMRNTDDPFNDMVEDYLDYLESIGELRKSREEEKADLIADLEAGYIHPSEIEYALSSTEWDPLAEGPGFDKWADERAASQIHKLKNPHPKTWHDVDKKLGKATDKMSQSEKVKKGLAHPDTLKKKGVAEGQTPEQEIERLKLRQNAEHGGASLKRQAETQARIRELEKQIKDKKGVAEGKIRLSTDPNWYGAEVGDYKASGPVVNIPTNRLVGFEPDDKMNQPASKANVEKIVAGLKQGAKLPPLLVRQYKNGYQVLDGHHRFWAYKLLGVKSIPAQVVPTEDVEEVGKQGVAEGQLDEISADPAYLRAAERSRSQAQATQRTPGKSPEEKAAARRTELKRDAGIAGYSKRHKAAHPEMYPKVKAQPAPRLRDPSTEYSDDYSTWAAGRRDTMEDPDQPKQEKRKRLDPELKNLATYAQGHYTDYRDDPETALLKLLQRSSEHGEETDRQQDRKIRNLERKINTVNQQMSSMPMAESRAQRRTLLKKILKG